VKHHGLGGLTNLSENPLKNPYKKARKQTSQKERKKERKRKRGALLFIKGGQGEER
jgi:hypothetical protein